MTWRILDESGKAVASFPSLVNGEIGIIEPPPGAVEINISYAAGGALAAHEVKWYKFEVVTPDVITIDMGGSVYDTYLVLYDSMGNIVASDDDSGGSGTSKIVTEELVEGWYYIASFGKGDHSFSNAFVVNGGTSNGNFSISVSGSPSPEPPPKPPKPPDGASTFSSDLRRLHQDSGIVELFDFDATSIGGGVYHLTPYYLDGGTISFDGVVYSSFPVASFGWELTTTGTMPRPTIQVSNVTSVFLASIVALGDLTGMQVTRFFTYERYLDGQPEEDPTMHSRKEVYHVEQKLDHTNTAITWQLVSPIDRANIILPRRQYLKDEVGNNVWAPGLSRYLGAM